MPGLLPDIDPDGLLEFSVVYTDRALNHMSQRFVGVMQDILGTLKDVYGAQTAVLVPGSGTFGMEAVARQFANGEKVLIVRNGWFSYRWTQIFEAGGFGLGGGDVVCKARKTGVDVLISAPQKGWSSSPCCAMVMLSARAREAIESTQSSSFACDLKKWMQIAEGYEKGQHAYHATLPTDALVRLRDVMLETRAYGFDAVKQEQIALGSKVRALLESRGFPSVAAEGFKAPGVVVSYTTDPGIQSGKKFLEVGLQTASGVPLMCDEGPDFKTFRIGLFGLEKWHHVDRTVGHLSAALDALKLPVVPS